LMLSKCKAQTLNNDGDGAVATCTLLLNQDSNDIEAVTFLSSAHFLCISVYFTLFRRCALPSCQWINRAAARLVQTQWQEAINDYERGFR